MNVDVVIIGGGPIGAALAIALKDLPLSIALVEARDLSKVSHPQLPEDIRSLALSRASINIMKSLNCWEQLRTNACPIKTIHVSKQNVFGKATLKAEQHDLEAFGYVVELHRIEQALQTRLQHQENLTLFSPASALQISSDAKTITLDKTTIQTKLLIAADGTNSNVAKLLNIQSQSFDYHQKGIVANVSIAHPHQGQAFERFLQEGLLALLPLNHQYMSLVWATNQSERLLALDDQAFLNELQHNFGFRLGRFTSTGPRLAFPLIRTERESDKLIFVGNASQTLHPIAGQGFNLGLRDVAQLAEQLATCSGYSPEPLISQYYQQRQQDKTATIQLTDGLLKGFKLNWLSGQILQSAGLALSDLLPPIQSLITLRAMGLATNNSKMACQIPLEEAF